MDDEALAQWFATNKTLLETAYLAAQDPWQQSGSGIGRQRTVDQWIAQRRCIADCVERSGSFLDVGCANGYLLECLLHWTQERDLEMVPYGLDFSEALVTLARERLPAYADHLFVGNAWDWSPPRPFDYVRTNLEYVPDELQRQWIGRMLDEWVSPRGWLLVAEYRGRDDLAAALRVDERLADIGFKVKLVRKAYWQGIEKTRLAIIEK
ncbi:MAG TPA: class I SAM-dependent methyltransferase [Ktedonobacterales bacterium]|nr:class I SAM-dependent methyltransferase [Ktedonobacterales bacterium]